MFTDDELKKAFDEADNKAAIYQRNRYDELEFTELALCKDEFVETVRKILDKPCTWTYVNNRTDIWYGYRTECGLRYNPNFIEDYEPLCCPNCGRRIEKQ